ncbi:hypothetical protein BDW72DRAFT_208684 [Aspergillus terricola var. indicus]
MSLRLRSFAPLVCLESDAVEILFDNFWDEGFGQAPGDQNSYRTGVIGKHNVVLAYMPQMGKGPAATISAHLRSSLRTSSYHCCSDSIFLGDIVISESITNYDYGRRLPDGSISREPAWTPNFRVANLKRRTHHHHNILRGKDKKYEQPRLGRDRLFKPSYRHKHYPPQSCMACSTNRQCKEAQDSTCGELECDLGQCIQRSCPTSKKHSLEGLGQQFSIHFGGVASGDTHGTIAFEMGGAGVCPNLQCIIVKGVCDYADSHKDKLWQPFAAGIAAACMKAMLDNGSVVLEQYVQTSSSLRQCRRCLPRDTNLRRILKTWRTKFRTGVETLLANGTGSSDDAQSMVTDCNHQGWQSSDVGRSICDHLGSVSGFCFEVVLEIQQKLSTYKTLAVWLKDGDGNGVSTSIAFRLLPELTIKASLDDLGSLVRVFSSIIPEHREPKLQVELPDPPPTVVTRAIEHFRIVQQAAHSLYDALGNSCTQHSLHNVHLSLQPRLKGTSTQVEFSVALGSDNTNSREHFQSMWINVESISRLQPTETKSAKHPADQDGRSPTTRRKRVRFHSVSESMPSSLPLTLRLEVPDLFLQRNLCSVVQRLLHAQLTLCNNCIGILGDSTACRHLIYINPQAEKAVTSASLSELISMSKRNSAKSLGAYDRVRLAKYLATAVLYYHTTPWLNRHWRSEDVRFFGNAKDGSLLLRSPEALPYISACVHVTTPERGNHLQSEYDLIVRNPVIFGLGVMLLELAYQAPFDDLKQEVDFRQGPVSFPNYVAAKRLAENVNVHISASFKRIVKKCLDCDFGHDTDFQSPALQDAFYYQVVGGLEEIEKKLQRLQLDE